MVTMDSAVAPGAIGWLGHSTLVHEQLAAATVIERAAEETFLISTVAVRDSPFGTVPRSSTVGSNRSPPASCAGHASTPPAMAAMASKATTILVPRTPMLHRLTARTGHAAYHPAMLIDPRHAVSALLAASLISAAPADDQAAPAPAPPAAATAPAKGASVDPKAKAIADRAKELARKLDGLETTTQLTVEGVDPSMLPPGATDPAMVALDFTKMPAGSQAFPAFVMECTSAGKPAERMVFDGNEAMVADAASKTYMKGGKDWQGMVGPRMMSFPGWFIENRLGMEMPEGDGMPKIVEVSVVGEETVDGKVCDLVSTVRTVTPEAMGDEEGGPQGEIRLVETVAYAREDGLPRRVTQSQSAGGESMKFTTSFANLKANPKHPEGRFSTAAPEGYGKMEAPAQAEEGPSLKFKAGDAAPPFELVDLSGATVSLASLKGKVVLLDFWATWCGPCKAAMPAIQKIHDDYKGKGVAVLGINTWENKEDAAKQYIDKKGFTYPCLLKGDDLAKAYGMTGIPTLVVIGKDGKIVDIEVGMAPDGDAGLRKAIDTALAAQ